MLPVARRRRPTAMYRYRRFTRLDAWSFFMKTRSYAPIDEVEVASPPRERLSSDWLTSDGSMWTMSLSQPFTCHRKAKSIFLPRESIRKLRGRPSSCMHCFRYIVAFFMDWLCHSLGRPRRRSYVHRRPLPSSPPIPRCPRRLGRHSRLRRRCSRSKPLQRRTISA